MIGVSLQRRGAVWWMAFGSEDTKNRRPIEVPLPDDFTRWIDRYLECYRPELARRSAAPAAVDAFWISHRGRPLTGKEIGKRVTAVTKRELGRDICPHLFRKIIPDRAGDPRSGACRGGPAAPRPCRLPDDAASLQPQPSSRCRPPAPPGSPNDTCRGVGDAPSPWKRR